MRMPGLVLNINNPLLQIGLLGANQGKTSATFHGHRKMLAGPARAAPRLTAIKRVCGNRGVVVQLASFSSKRRTRFGEGNRRDDKIFSGLRVKQEAQFKKLRDALEKEDRAAIVAKHSALFSGHTCPIVDTGDSTDSKRRKQMREFEKMMVRKAARQDRVKHLPLFRENSALWTRYGGEQSLGQYDHLPVISFDGPVHVIHSAHEEVPFVSYLQQQRIIGVDTESMPRFDYQKTLNPVCLIQVATLEQSFLYRIPRGGELPPQLRSLLEDSAVVKIGHSLDDDFRLLEMSQMVRGVHTTLDTLPIATNLGCLRPGLKTLCQLFLGGVISKEMQVSNWEAPTLSADQIRYAATDAWAPLAVMLKMVQLKEAIPFVLVKSYTSGSGKSLLRDAEPVVVALQEYVLEHGSRDLFSEEQASQAEYK